MIEKFKKTVAFSLSKLPILQYGMIGNWVLLSLFVFILSSLPSYSDEKKGVLDLSRHDFNENPIVELSGHWEIYMAHIIDPKDIHLYEKEMSYSPHTSKWEDFNDANGNIGYGTFRLTVLLPESMKRISFQTKGLQEAWVLWLNGIKVEEVGTVGKDLEESQPMSFHGAYTVSVKNNQLEIVFQSSNFRFLNGGFRNPMYLGKPKAVHDNLSSYFIRYTFLVGAIVFMGLYHVILWFFWRNSEQVFWFSSTCILFSYWFTSAHNLIYNVIPHDYYFIAKDLEVLSYVLGMLSLSLYIRDSLPNQYPVKFLVMTKVFSISYALIIVLTPMEVYERFLFYFQIYTLLIIVSIIFTAIRAVINKVDGSKGFAFGVFILTVTMVVDLLSILGVFPRISIVGEGVFASLFFQTIAISRKFCDAFKDLERAKEKIRDINTHLEMIVEKRTKTIRMILDHVKTGFLLIDRDLIVLEGFTKSCSDLFGKEIKEGVSLSHLLRMNVKSYENYYVLTNQIFDDLLPEDVNLKQLPRKFKLENKALTLEPSVVRDSDGEIQSILLTITDITNLEQAEKQADFHKIMLNIALHKGELILFTKSFFESVGVLKLEVGKEQTDITRNILHTLKGNCAAYGLEDMTNLIHLTEDKSIIDESDLNTMNQLMRIFLRKIFEATGIDIMHADSTFEVEMDQLSVLKETVTILDDNDDEVKDYIFDWVDQVSRKKILSLIGFLELTVEKLSADLKKDVSFNIEGGSIRVDPEYFTSILHNLVHPIRNALSYGIEPPGLRGAKPKKGLISLCFLKTEAGLNINIRDDGKGIDLSFLKEYAIREGLVAPQDINEKSDDFYYNLIFQSGLTSANKVSKTSGRGVGMNSFYRTVRECGGSIDVTSKAGQGTMVSIFIPYVWTLDQKSDENMA